MTRQCECGGTIPKRYGSTIQMKMCPKCTLKQATAKATVVGGTPTKKKGGNAAMRTADKWFSRYIRLKYSFPDQSGKERLCRCYTSGKVKHILNIDLGHYHNRGIYATRYHEDNARPQGKHHNRYKSGAHTTFEANLVDEIGVEAVEALKALTKAYFKADQSFFRDAATEYRNKFNDLIKQLGIDDPWKPKKTK